LETQFLPDGTMQDAVEIRAELVGLPAGGKPE